jgi:multidrug efflux pump subunit AcrA (membrane-fusion protein)
MKIEETFNPATNQNSICPDITAQWQLAQVSQKDKIILQEKIGNRCYQFSLVEGYALQHFTGEFTIQQIQNLCQQRFVNIDHDLVLQLFKKLLILNILENPKAAARPKLKSSVQWTYNPEGYWILDNPEDKTSSPMQVGEADKAVIDDLGKSQQEICAKHSIPPQHLQQLLSMLAATGMLEGTQQAVPTGHKFNPLQLLFFRLPLVNPDPWLDQHIDQLRWIWTRQFSFFLIIFLTASVVVGLSKQSLILFTGQTIWNNHGLSVLIPFILLCGLVVAIHELSHAFTLKHYGGTVPEIGLLMICLMPGCYTDTTASYHLVKRRQRVLVVGAGVLCQVILWAIGLWLWLLLAETSWLKNISYLLMAAALLTVVINLNPLARFDGYYLASALSGINNLRDRSFQFYADLLRRRPLPKEPNTRWILATYAPFSLLYSLLVFGHLLLWLTGWSLTNIPFWTLLLLSIWAIYFYAPSMTTNQPDNRPSLKVVSPNLKTATVTQKQAEITSWKPNIILGLSVLSLGVLGLLPVPDKVSGTAVVELMPYQYQSVSVPEQATVEKIHVRNNQAVRRGDKLVTFSQRELTRTLQDVESKLREAQSRRDAALQQKLVADSKLNKATISEQSTRQNVTRLQQKIAQMATGDNSLLLQLKTQQDIKRQQIFELKSNLDKAENQIQLGQKAADAQAISSKQWDELIQKRTNIQTQISTATMEIKGIDAQIAQVKERTQEELLNQRLPEANDKMKEVEVASQEVKAAESQVQQLQSLVESWQAQQKQLINQQNKLMVIAERDGIVNATGLETNEHRKVSEGQELLKIVDLKQLTAAVEVSPEEARRVKFELPVTFRPDADFHGYSGKVIEIPQMTVVSSASSQAPQPPRVKVRILFDQPAQGLILGATGNAHIQISQIRVYQHLQREFLKLFNPGRFF